MLRERERDSLIDVCYCVLNNKNKNSDFIAWSSLSLAKYYF